MPCLRLVRARILPAVDVAYLATQAASEGHLFVGRLAADWASGRNRFEGAGEFLLLVWHASRLVGTCGLNQDPYQPDSGIGRLRRLYVALEWRGHGLGSSLTTSALSSASPTFRTVRRRTHAPPAAAFYRRRGFREVGGDDATHEIQIARGLAVR